MHYPDFFSQIRSITLFDPLAAFLGTVEGGLIEYTYADAAKLAGHSCPTVAGAYLSTLKALAHLYPGTVPERGAIKVSFRDPLTSGVTGVMANIATLITGATHESGFKGIAGQFDRRNRLFFDAAIDGEIRFKRADSGAEIVTVYHPERVPPSPSMKELMLLMLAGAAGENEKKEFGRLWQDRVKHILIDHADDPELIVLR